MKNYIGSVVLVGVILARLAYSDFGLAFFLLFLGLAILSLMAYSAWKAPAIFCQCVMEGAIIGIVIGLIRFR